MTSRAAALTALAFGAAAPFVVGERVDAERAATDADLLNFALNLEYAQAEFYAYAVFGKGLDDSNVAVDGTGAPGATIGGSRVPLRGPLLARTAHQLARDEAQHVALLRDILGRDVVAKPLIDLGGFGVGFADLKEFLVVARVLEDVAVSAYAAIVPLVQAKETLTIVTRLLAAEAEQSGNVRLLAGLKGARAVSFDAKDVPPPPAGTEIFSLDRRALATTRSPEEIVAIVKPLFPHGFNGPIK